MKVRYIIIGLMMLLAATAVRAQITIGGNVYGGGNAGDTKGNTNVTIYAGDLNRVFGGAQKADVGGHAFVHIDGEKASDYVLINHVYGGNDVSGVIGNNSELTKSVPTEIKKATDNLVDESWSAFVRISSKMDGDHVADDNQKIYIGQLFGGGNGAYDYDSEKLSDGVTPNPYYHLSKPELAKSYLEVMGGSIVYAFGGGNNATVTEKTIIYVDNPSKVVNEILVDGVDQITKDNRVVDKMGLNPGYTYPSSDAYQIGSFFGGNNTAEMKIRPRWNLKSGKIRNVYSGGNKGDMTSPEGLLLQIFEGSSIIVDNVYGGCRMADVTPKDENGNPVTAAAITQDDFGHELHIPAGMAARARILGGHVNNVYGGNDITGRISGGSTVGIYTTIYGDVYGGGNGSYPYTDNAALKDDPTYGDLYYTIPEGKTSVQALNDYRPNAEQVSIYVQGTETKKTIIHGSVYCGGNSASLSSSMDNPKVELKVGSYAIVDNLFLGNNGEHMVETHPKDATHAQEGVLRTYKKKLNEIDPIKYADNTTPFSTMDLGSQDFATYMEGVTMSLIPSIVFAKKPNDPDDYVPYSSYFGSIYCGGNVGSMKIDGKKTSLNFTENIIVYNKLVGGCNNANVASTDFNAAYEGGFIGTPDTNGDKLQLNLSGLKIQPKRWKKKIGDYEPDRAEGESYDTYTGYTDYVVDANGNHLLEWNTISSSTGKEVLPVLSGTGESTADDKDRRFTGGNIYGGCYNSGHINGNVIINMNSTVVDRKGTYAVFDQVQEDEGEAKLYENDTYHITTRVSGVILDEQGMDVLGSALNVFGGGYGKDSEIWGNVTVNLNAGYTFQIFGGGEQGVIGKPNDGTGDDYIFNGKTFKYNPKYSCTINVKGNFPGVARNATGDNDNMAAAEFIYGGGFKGPVCGNTIINLGNGRVFNTFAGSCDADILGHTETYVGRNTSDDTDLGFPYVRDHVYGGNDLGGSILGSADFSERLSTDLPITPYKPQETSVTTASAYMEYVQGHVDYIFGGCYGDYDYATKYAGYTSPRMENAFVNFKPNQHNSNELNKIFGAGQGAAGFNLTDKNQMQNRSYVLMDLADTGAKFADLEVFGAGQNCGVGMGVAKETADANADGVTAAAVIDLARGQIGAAYGGSLNEGVTRRTIVNVPVHSTIRIGSIFAGAYGSDIYQPCDVYEGNVNYHSADAYLIYNPDNTLMKGAIYGGNNQKRRTLYGKINIDVPVRQSRPDGSMTTATIYGAGCGSRTWNEYTEVNLINGANVWEVYGGGEAGGVMSAESVEKYVTALKPKKDEQGNDMTDAKWQAAWTLGGGYDPDMASFPGTFDYDAKESTNLQNTLARPAEVDDRKDTEGTPRFKRYNTNVIINEGAYVGNYAYGGGYGKADDQFAGSGDVYGTTYIALLGGRVNKDIYAAGTMGTVYDLFGATNFIASANAYIKGGTARNVYGGGWAGAVGKHTGTISDATTDDIPGETHVVIGDLAGTSFANGIPAIERNAYGGGEGGAVFGTTNITLNKGYIGYRYFTDQASADPGEELIGITDTDGGGYYQEKLHDETWKGDGSNRLKDSGNIFGGGYVDNSSVDRSNVTMYGGHVRGALFGGGEIAAVGRGVINATGENNSVRTLQGIYKAGKTNVKLYGGHVHRNVFGGGRGYNNLGEGGKLYSDGYVFGQTEVDIHGGEVGTDAELANGNGNVFGGGDIGYVYSAYEDTDGTLCFGMKSGVRYDDRDEGYYYQSKNGKYVNVGGEKILTEDCKVLVEPWTRVTTATTINGHSYAVGDYVPTSDLNNLGNKNSGDWGNLDTEGITIHNAVFAGGNTSSGSDKVYANATSIFGNATASIHDVYNRDLITLGTNHVGGLYGDGNLTFVDGYRGLNITNYGTDFYSIKKEITIDEYNALPPREAAYYELRYTCIQDCTDDDGTAYHPKDPNNANSKASTLSALEIISLFKEGKNTSGVLDADGKISSVYWQENGVLPVYAGRPMNTIQRADFCGVFGSRMVMQGAQDRVPEIADYTNYTINRVREVSLNKKESVRDADRTIQPSDENYYRNRVHGNYFGIYNIVNYFGALTSDVDFQETVRVTDNTDETKYKSAAVTPSDTYPYGTATYEQWKEAHKADRTRNNGNSHNKVALASGVYLELTTEKGTGTDLYEKDWGYITGVVELDLINVQTGIGGGFVYAKNEHGKRSPSGKTHTTITDLNTGAVTQKDFVYTTDDATKDEWQSSGNFVHSTQVIIDDCYNVSGKYKGTVAPGGAVPAHYWYIQGSVYVYDQYISAYTGAPNAYSEQVEIPLTITAASHGTMKLLNVQPNYYAYYASSGIPLGDDQKLIINDVTYYKNDPISYWDYYLLSQSEKNLFVPETYVTIGDCKVNGTPYAEGTVLLPDQYDELKNSNPQVTYEEDGVEKNDKGFDYFFRSSNNLSHDTGFILTYKVNNPTPWDTWYTKYSGSQTDKKQTAADGYNNGPTYRLKDGLAGGLLGQREYKESDVISKSVYDTYQTAITTHSLSPAGQADFEDAYVITKAVDVTVGTSTRHLNPGAVISATEKTSYGLSEANSSPAYISTRTIQLSATDYIYQGSKMSLTEKNNYITNVTNDISDILPAAAAETVTKMSDLTEEQLSGLSADKKKTLAQLLATREEIKSDIVPAYYCITAGLYGGNYYQGNTNYRGLEAWSSMSDTDRQQFTFNYDAFDLLIDPTYGGTVGKKYQYDGATTKEGAEQNRAGYSIDRPVDYTATYNGNDNELVPGKEYTRQEYEALPNEKRYYSGIVVDDADAKYYVVNTSFQIGNTPYAVGATISSSVYESLGDTDKGYVTELQFDETGTYYYCREPYTGTTAVTPASGVTGGKSYTSGEVPIGVVIDAACYGTLPNKQTDFTIHGIAPTEVSTLYVSRNSDIFDLSKEKIITVIYQYDYEEADANGNITPQSERHVVNIHLNFKSGVPYVENIKVPQIVLPGDNVALREPVVTPGAYEIMGGGWEIFETVNDAESHSNGIEYSPNSDPLYWYQHGYYVAYYAKTYLGKTYSNHVPLSVANYHDLGSVMADKEHHYYIDHEDAIRYRNPKIYINDATNGLQQLKDFFDLSVHSKTDGVTDGKVTESNNLNGHALLSEQVKGCDNLDLMMHTNITVPENTDWTPIANNDGECFEGTLHGDGYYISGLNKSLFNHLCGSVYNLGVMGSFTGAGVAKTGEGYVENCWVKSTNTSAKTARPVFGDPSRAADDAKGAVQVVNSYYLEDDDVAYGANGTTPAAGSYTKQIADAADAQGYVDHGTPFRKNSQAFYNGEVAYGLNGFYLWKRYCDQKVSSRDDAQKYQYYTVDSDNKLTLQPAKYYESEPTLCSSGYKPSSAASGYVAPKYVEDRYADGDFIYANGTIPETSDERLHTYEDNGETKTVYYPIWPDDYLYFGQTLTYGHEASRAHQKIPSHINRSGNRLQTDATCNRVYRAPAYFQSEEMSMAHFNPNAIFAQTKNGDANVIAYKNMTAIDFTGGNGDVSGGYKKGLNGKFFYAPLLDDGGLTAFRNVDLTQNLLVYTGSVSPASAATDAVVTAYLPDVAYSETRTDYRTVAIASTIGVKGHQIAWDGSAYTSTKDHLLVDKQDFNCPIQYTFDDGHRMWYQRKPDNYVDRTKGWEDISIPFSAELVTTQQKGEITHFYTGSENSYNDTNTKRGHEYWLREFANGGAADPDNANIYVANFNYPAAGTSGNKSYTNTFLWDYYYQYSDAARQDKNTDTYQQDYYKESHTYADYGYSAAAKPYIIGFPGKTYYEFDLSGGFKAANTYQPIDQLDAQVITFASPEGTTIAVSDEEIAEAIAANKADGYAFTPNYLGKPMAEGYYQLNAEGSSYEKVAGSGTPAVYPNAVPFRPYFTGASAARTRGVEQIVFNQGDSSFGIEDRQDPRSGEAGTLTITAEKGRIIVSSSLGYATDVRIVTPAGMSLSTFTVEPGQTIETPVLFSGIYIVRSEDGIYTKKLSVMNQ